MDNTSLHTRSLNTGIMAEDISFFNNETPQILLTPTDDGVMMTDTEYSNGQHELGFSEEGMERISALEEKTRSQDMEISLLKSALSNVLAELATIKNNAPTGGSPPKKKTGDSPKPFNRTKSENSMKTGKPPPVTISKQAKNRSMTGPSSPSTPTKNSPPSFNNTPVKKRVAVKTNSTGLSTRNHPNRKSMPEFTAIPENLTEGKPKLILAQKRQSIRKKSSSNSDENNNSNGSPVDDVVKFYIRGRGIRLYRPTNLKDTNPEGRAPEETLKLDWVYGYRGKDCRDNLFMLPSTGELVYNMAGVIVLYDATNNKQRHYTGHNDDVKCVAMHPNETFIASGQVAGHGDDAKPHVRVWDATTLETKTTFGHSVFERGLCALEFSKDTGSYLVCIDESNDHVAYLYDWEKGTKLAEVNASKEILFSIKWQPGSDSSFLTYGKSHIGIWKINTEVTPVQMTKKLGIFEKMAKAKYVLAAVYSPEGEVIIGDSNGSIMLFGDGCCKVSHNAIGAHQGGVFSLTYIKNQDQFISGGKDLSFITWSRQLEKIQEIGTLSEQYGPPRCCLYDATKERYLIGTTKNSIVEINNDWSEEKIIVQGHCDEMWGLATHPTQPLFVTCSHDNLVCVWNGESQEILWSYSIEDHAQCAEMHSTEPFVLIGTKSGTVYILNYESKEELITLPVSRDSIDDIKVSPDSKQVAVASRDTHIYLYNWPKEISGFKKPKVLQGHSSRVLHLDWSIDGEFLQSNSGDYEVLFWHAESGCQVLTPAALRDVEWFSYTCPFGFPVMGIWPEGADGTDINTCCRSHGKNFVATGDDFGAVNLFKYPSIKLKSECQVGVGHSSHVTCVRFLSNDHALITVGGNDSSIMQWKLTK